MIKIEDGEVRPEECMCEPCSDISFICNCIVKRR